MLQYHPNDGDRDPLIEVLLATYNGERFLREQIDSIFTQDYKNFQILARDDGSTDGTVSILEEYATRFPDRFRIVERGPATGSAQGNFLKLMQLSSAPYAALADQDDVWLPNKVTLSMGRMKELESQWGEQTPLLVFSDLCLVNERLETIHPSFWADQNLHPSKTQNFASLIAENVVTGCTAMLNRPLVEISRRMSKSAAMHDHWIALLASAVGHIAWIDTPTVLYRQHDSNVAGFQKKTRSPRQLWAKITSGSRAMQWKINQRQAAALLEEHHQDLPEHHRSLLEAYLRCGTSRSRIERVATFCRCGFFRSGLIKNAAMLFELWNARPDESDCK